MTISFIASAAAGLSMFGVPPLLGYLAKEEIYLSLGLGDAWGIVAMLVLVIGNALLGAVALALVIRPFMGPLRKTPHEPHEGGIALWIGPALFGLLGFSVVFAVSAYGQLILAPMASSIVGYPVESHLGFAIDPGTPPVWLSLATWVLAILVCLRLDALRILMARLGQRLSWRCDRGFDQALFGLIRVAAGMTRMLHHGRLELYLVVMVAAFSLLLLLPLATLGGWPALPAIGRLTFYEWGVLAIAAVGIVMVIMAQTRLLAIIALGVQGLAVGLVFLLFGAPDLAFTQLMVEVVSVVIVTLAMTRLNLSSKDPRPYEDWLRDGTLSLLAAVAICAVLFRVLEGTFDGRLSAFFAANSVPIAHGHNIVNVILVDFRGLDTLGEISVVMTAGIAILALLKRRRQS